jgi:hypothetical protein
MTAGAEGGPDAEELASFTWGGQRARPRKGIELVMKKDATYLKPPGSLLSKWPGLGVGVEVECCENCNIYILDASERVQVSECINCRIVVGPTCGSVMLFECKGCTITVASKQIRLRDCVDCDMRVFGAAHECVVIETSKKLRIGAWDLAYAGLAAQFRMTGWVDEAAGKYVNHSSAVHDFSPPSGGGKNWAPLAADPTGCWCELVVEEVEGLTGGKVSEVRVATPTTEGAECPCGLSILDLGNVKRECMYEAKWFSAAAEAAEAIVAKRAKAAATAAATTAAAKPKVAAATAAAAAAKPKVAAATAAAAAAAKPKVAAAAKPTTTGNSGAAAAADAPAKPGLLSRLLSWLLGGKKSEPAAAVDLADVKIQGDAKTTQVCIVS